jgi:alpha-1,6-mannosyltransferase
MCQEQEHGARGRVVDPLVSLYACDVKRLVPHGLAGLAAGCLVLLGLLAGFSGGAFEPWLWRVLVVAVAGGALAAGAALWRPVAQPGWGPLAAALALAFAVRLALVFSDNMVCDDAARYHWDGKVMAHGVNPYAYPPNARELDSLRTTALDRGVNVPWCRTPYPPLAEAVFLAAYALAPDSLTGYKALTLAFELAAWLVLLLELARLGLPRARVLLAAFAPLLVIEGYLPGHSDMLALPFVALLVMAVLRGRPALAGLALAAACLVKPLALVFLPAAARELGARRTGVLLAVLAAVTAAAYAPLLATGVSHLGPMLLMAHRWSFNGTVAALVDRALPAPAARIVSTALLAALVTLATAWGRDFLSRALMALAAVFVMSPVLFPWYVVWAVPLLVLRPDPALIALAVLVPTTDIAAVNVYVHRRLEAPLWSTLAAFVPFYVLLVAGFLRGWGMFRREDVG